METLKAGENLLLVKVTERDRDWSMFVGLQATFTAAGKTYEPSAKPGKKITGPWLWMIVPSPECGDAGIDVDSAPQARRSILEQVEMVRQGRFSDEVLEMTRQSWDSSLRMIQDSPASLAEFDLRSRVTGRETDLAGLRYRIAAVTKDGVVEVAQRIELDLVYLMAPEEAS